ncbi:MAG TPA: DUF938 domain-containing protein [Leucothrix mucor]|uniref:DUF938 domain-containing protein n=1 Tax=Leucothrix mucor TaxID=45248 RepID=A0A7V2T4A4_LEUMU|nr:DUF938 domain-containing protein [Leucothrix mucor]
MNKPFADSCQQNQEPILNVIQPLLQHCQTVLEIGSGTGQHAVYFAANMPHLHWQTSDRIEYHQGINLWLQESNNPNIYPPIALDVSHDEFPKQPFDAIFTANTLHIMSKDNVSSFFQKMTACMQANSILLAYGPFNYNGKYTSDSNVQFDRWLKSRDINSGIKDFEWLNELANAAGLESVNDYTMPANNRILHWNKTK